MSMIARFIQLDEEEFAKLQADPSLAETLFMEGPPLPPAFAALSKTVQERMRTAGPQIMAATLEKLPPEVRRQLEARLGRTTPEMAAGLGADNILKLMEERMGLRTAMPGARARPALSLDKAWHGVHYILCGSAEPGSTPLSKAVMGGEDLGQDDEGFSGYGPARCFSAAEVAAISRELNQPGLETEAAARFDPAKMSALDIYPGWRGAAGKESSAAEDKDWVMDAFRRLRDFYKDAAGQGRAIVTCLV
jgi:hypothetical protein